MEQRTVAGGLVGVLGGILAGMQVVHGLQLTAGAVAFAFEAGPFTLLALTLPYVGYWLLASDLQDADAVRVLAWSVGGALLFASIGALLLFSQRVAFGTLSGAYSLTVDTITVGTVCGALVGLYDAKRREHVRDLAAQRDRIESFANTAADVNNYGRALSQADSVRDVSALCIEAMQMLLGLDRVAVVRFEGQSSEVLDSLLVGADEEAVIALARNGRAGEAATVTIQESVPEGVGEAAEAMTVAVCDTGREAVVCCALTDDPDFADEDVQLLELLVSHAAVRLERLLGAADATMSRD